MVSVNVNKFLYKKSVLLNMLYLFFVVNYDKIFLVVCYGYFI